MPQFLILLILLILSKNAPAKTFDVDISTGRPAASNEAYYHGETIEFRAVRGRSVVTNIEYSCVYYQTNGMDSVWWHTDGLVFHPTNDVGAASYRFFMEGRDDLGRDWHANGLLRLLPSPGFTPNTIELPVARLDFAAVEVANAPYYDKAETEAKIVELAPAPGNYAAVSNAAVHAAATNALQDTAISTLSQSLDAKADETTPVVQTATLPDECFPITWNDGDSYSPTYYTANKDQSSITPTQGGYQLSAFGIVIGSFGKSPRGVWEGQGSGPVYDLMFNGEQPIHFTWPQLDFSPSTGGDVVRSTGLAAGLEGKADSLSGIGTVGGLVTAMLPGEFFPITFTYGGKQLRLYSAYFSTWAGSDIVLVTSVGDTISVAEFDSSTGIYKRTHGGVTNVTFAGVAPVPGKWPFVRLPGQTYGGLVVRSAELAEEMSKKMPANATGADIPVDATQGAQTISAALADKASTAEVDKKVSYANNARNSIALANGQIVDQAGNPSTNPAFAMGGVDHPARAWGYVSYALGFDADASAPGAFAVGNNAKANGDSSIALGFYARTLHNVSFVWQGADGNWQTPSGRLYDSHGPGTYNIYPVGGLAGFWIGEQNMQTLLGAKADKPSTFTPGHLAALDAQGNPTDSGVAKSAVESLLFAQYYPDGSVKSAAEFTAGIKYDAPDTTNRTITVKPFCNTHDSDSDNSGLEGRVVIPPFVDAQGNPYINDNGSRFKVVGVSSRSGSVDANIYLTAIVAPNTVTNTGGNTFAYCLALTTVSFPGATTVGESAFYNCTALTSVSLPAATTIEDGAFYNCTALTSVSLPAATTIEDGAFRDCSSLTSISLPAATNIGTVAFEHCSSLTSVSLPAATTIWNGAFNGCDALTSVDFGDTPRSTTVPTLGNDAFYDVPTSCKIIVPDEQYDDWTAASGWSSLVTQGYQFLKYSEWEYARKYEVDKKADKPANPTNGNLVKVSGTGELQDAGKSLDDISQEIADAGFVTVIGNACHSDRQSTPVIIWDWNNSGQRHYFTNRFPDYTFDAADQDYLCMMGFGLPGAWNFNPTITDTYFILNSATQDYATKFGRITIPVNVANANGRFRITISYCMSAFNSSTLRNCNFDVDMDGVTVAQIRDAHASMTTTSEVVVFADVDGAPSHSLTLSAANSTAKSGVVISGVKVDFMAADIETVAPDADAQTGQAADAKATHQALAGKLDAASAFPAFSEDSTYVAGKVVTHDGGLYVCSSAVETPGAWDDAEWTATTIAALLSRTVPVVLFDESLLPPESAPDFYEPGNRSNFEQNLRLYFPDLALWGVTLNSSAMSSGAILVKGDTRFPEGIVLFNRGGAAGTYTAELVRSVHVAYAATYRLTLTLSAVQALSAHVDVLLDGAAVPTFAYRGPNFTAGEVREVDMGAVYLPEGDHSIRIRGVGAEELAVISAKMETD